MAVGHNGEGGVSVMVLHCAINEVFSLCSSVNRGWSQWGRWCKCDGSVLYYQRIFSLCSSVNVNGGWAQWGRWSKCDGSVLCYQ